MTPEEARDVLARGCVGKTRYGARAARAIAEDRRRNQGDHRIEAYRCRYPEKPDDHWHVGRQPSVERLCVIAQALRVLSGNSPEPEHQETR